MANLMDWLVPPSSPLASALQLNPNTVMGGQQSPPQGAPPAQPPAPPPAPSPVQQATPRPQPSPIDQRLAEREAQYEREAGLYGQYAEQQAKGYEQGSENQSALKQLLLDTQQRLGGLQYGPSKQEMLNREIQAFTGGAGPHWTGGIGAAGGAASGAAAQGEQEARQGALMREQLMAKYGMDANQAAQMANQYQIQAAGSRMQGILPQMNQANSAIDRLTNQSEMDKYRRMMMALQYGLGGGGQQQQFDPKNPDETTLGLANYEAKLGPRPTTARNPGMLATAQSAWDKKYNEIKAVNPDFREGQYDIANAARKSFNAGPLGNKIIFANNVFGHLNTYSEMLHAVNAGDIPGANRIAQQFGIQIGHPEVTSAQAVQDILGPEIVKAIVPNAGTGHERLEEIAQLAASQAPEQWGGRYVAYHKVLGTQVADLRRGFYSSLLMDPPDTAKGPRTPVQQRVDQEFMRKLSPETQAVMAEHDHPRPAGVDPNWVLHQDPAGKWAYVSPDKTAYKVVP